MDIDFMLRRMSIDIGVDDVIVPKVVRRRVQTRLVGFKEPEIYTYSLESTIAEKFDAILKLYSIEVLRM